MNNVIRQRSASRGTAIIVALICAEFTAAFETTMIYAALKTFYATFDNPLLVGWMVTAYLLASAAAAAICSKLGDLFGRKRMLLLLLLTAMTGSLVSLMATDLAWIVAGRAVQGTAGAILPLCFAIAREVLPEKTVAKGVSAIGSTVVLAAGMGVLLGGILVQHFSWHGIFAASSLLAATSAVLVFFIVPKTATRYQGEPMDWLGGMLFVPALFAILIAVTIGQRQGWTSGTAPVLALTGVILSAVWVRHELRIAHPLINLRLLSCRPLIVGTLSMAVYGLGPLQAQVFTLLLQQPTWTGIGLGLSPSLAGLYLMPGQIAAFLAAPFAALLYLRVGERKALFVSTGLLLTGSAMLFSNSLPVVVVAMTISAIGTVFYYSTIPNIIVRYAPPSNTGECAGIAQVARSVGQAVGAAIVAMILASSTLSVPGNKGAIPSGDALWLTLFFIVCVAGGLFLLNFIMPRHKPDDAEAVSAPAPAVAATAPIGDAKA